MFPQVSDKFFKWRAEQHRRKISETVDGETYEVEVEDADFVRPKEEPKPASAKKEAVSAPVNIPAPAKPQTAPAAGTGEKVTAPMPGTVLKLKAKNGSAIKKGQPILVLEAMKMENEIAATKDGIVTIVATEGSKVNSGDVLAYIS